MQTNYDSFPKGKIICASYRVLHDFIDFFTGECIVINQLYKQDNYSLEEKPVFILCNNDKNLETSSLSSYYAACLLVEINEPAAKKEFCARFPAAQNITELDIYKMCTLFFNYSLESENHFIALCKLSTESIRSMFIKQMFIEQNRISSHDSKTIFLKKHEMYVEPLYRIQSLNLKVQRTCKKRNIAELVSFLCLRMERCFFLTGNASCPYFVACCLKFLEKSSKN